MRLTACFTRLVFVAGILLSFPFATLAQEVDAKMAEITAQFQEAYDRDVNQPHEAAVADLDSKYSVALKRALDDATAAGNLEEALRLREETDRLAQKQALPPVDLDSLPDSLKQLRVTYRSALAKLEAERDAKSQPYYDHYDKLLEDLQTELTQAQKLDDALAVKAKRDSIALDRPKVPTTEPEPAMAAAQPEAPSPTSTTTSPSAVPTSSSPWRAAAEWVLSLKGRLEIEKDGQRKGIQKAEDLPPGKFDILYVTFSRYYPHDGKKMTDADLSLLNPIAKNLEKLTLDNCNINGSGLEAIAGATKLKFISLDGSPITDEALKHLRNLQSLQHLSVFRCPLTGTGFEHLRGLASLRRLEMNATSLTPEGGQALAQLQQLEELSGSTGNFRGDGSAFTTHVGKLTNLRSLGFGDTAPMTDHCLEHLQGLTKLERLTVSNSRISGAGLVHLKASASTLKSIQLLYQCPVSDPAVEIIANTLPNLEAIGIGYGATCGGDSLRFLARLPKLKNLGWASKYVLSPADWELFATMPELTRLNLADHKALDEVAMAALAKCKKLAELTARNTNLSDAGLAKLQTLKSLQALNISMTQVTDAAVDAFKKVRPDVKVSH